MIGKDEIAEAARYADARAEELGLPGWATQYGIDLEGLTYVAEQRAIRAGMILDGKNPASMPRDRMSVVRLTPAVNHLVPFIASVVIDGIAIGFTMKEQAEELSWVVGITATCERLGRFKTHDHAAAFISTLPDYDQGIYYIDPPPEGEV